VLKMFSSSTSGISKMLLHSWISPSSNRLWRGRSSFFTIFPFAPGVKKQANINSTAKSEERNKDHCEYFSFQGIKKRYSKHFRKFDPNILREPISKPGSHKDIKEASNAQKPASSRHSNHMCTRRVKRVTFQAVQSNFFPYLVCLGKRVTIFHLPHHNQLKISS